MKRNVLTTNPPRGLRRSRQIALLLVALIAVVALVVLLGAPHLLEPSVKGGKGGLDALENALKKIEGPGTAVFGTLSFLGLVAGGGMAAMGMQQGIRIMLTAGLAGGGVLLGKGLIA
jgi:hypothetical protein